MILHIQVIRIPSQVAGLRSILLFSVLLYPARSSTDFPHAARYPRKSCSNHCKAIKMKSQCAYGNIVSMVVQGIITHASSLHILEIT